MQNETKQTRPRARKKKTGIFREAGFSIRAFRGGFIVQVRRKGIRETKTFATLESARLHCQGLDTKRTNEGLAGFSLSVAEREDARRALDLLRGRTSLQAAAEAWSRLNPAADSLTVAQLFERHVEDIRKRNRRSKTIESRRQFLNRFAVDYGSRAACSITAADVETWLETRVPEKTFNTMRFCLGAAYSFALRQKLVDLNPVAAIAPRQFEHGEPHFWHVAEVAAIMNAAAGEDAKRDALMAKLKDPLAAKWPPHVPYLALSAFAGLRPTEAARMDWRNVNLEESLIRIPAAVSKVRRPRLVPMPANLVRWLLPYRQEAGRIAPSAATIKRARKAILKTAHIKPKWPQDILRHSFATHWMAKHSHEGQLAEMMGNSPAIIQRHYKGLATAKAGAKYFEIEPPAVGSAIRIGTAVA